MRRPCVVARSPYCKPRVRVQNTRQQQQKQQKQRQQQQRGGDLGLRHRRLPQVRWCRVQQQQEWVVAVFSFFSSAPNNIGTPH